MKRHTQITIFTILLLLLTSQQSKAQSPTYKAKADTFSFAIQEIQIDSLAASKEKIIPITAQRKYDFDAQYPYYEITKKDWKVGDFFQIVLHEVPDSLYLYLFSVDSYQNPALLYTYEPNTLQSIKGDSNHIILPGKEQGFAFQYIGQENLCFWLSNQPIQDYKRLIEGIELTIGTFLERVTGQSGRNLLLPGQNWQLLSQKTGLQLIEHPLFPHPKGFHLPLVVTFNIPPPKKVTPVPPPTPPRPKIIPQNGRKKVDKKE